ncbi:hypothetical protein E2C01_009168 [Portunus trituberculatus]|uniref:Uncharacterized protein n=1 Tax=Portunus trituberculatus TaxID=210409 RepID=A0A5B7D4R0_PORTR|nr:hypothetical protein [Portunus trituberculatus]
MKRCLPACLPPSLPPSLPVPLRRLRSLRQNLYLWKEFNTTIIRGHCNNNDNILLNYLSPAPAQQHAPHTPACLEGRPEEAAGVRGFVSGSAGEVHRGALIAANGVWQLKRRDPFTLSRSASSASAHPPLPSLTWHSALHSPRSCHAPIVPLPHHTVPSLQPLQATARASHRCHSVLTGHKTLGKQVGCMQASTRAPLQAGLCLPGDPRADSQTRLRSRLVPARRVETGAKWPQAGRRHPATACV